MRKIFILILLSILFVKTIGQTPKKSDFYYEQADTIAHGQNKYVKVIKIIDGQHTFYSNDKLIITKGTFKNGRLINGEQYFYNDRIVFYKDGKYDGYIHAEETSDRIIDSSKVKDLPYEVNELFKFIIGFFCPELLFLSYSEFEKLF